MLQSVMREELKRDPISSLGALMATSGLRRVRDRLDDSQYASVLLGLRGPVIVTHGRSKASAIQYAIRTAKHAIEKDLTKRIQDGVAASIVVRSQAELMKVSD